MRRLDACGLVFVGLSAVAVVAAVAVPLPRAHRATVVAIGKDPGASTWALARRLLPGVAAWTQQAESPTPMLPSPPATPRAAFLPTAKLDRGSPWRDAAEPWSEAEPVAEDATRGIDAVDPWTGQVVARNPSSNEVRLDSSDPWHAPAHDVVF